MKVRLFKPSLGKEELENIKEVFDRSWIGMGPKVVEFEQQWNRYIGGGFSIAVNSATAALHLALKAFGFPEGKKVLVPVLTFVSTAAAVLYNRLVPVFVDVDPDTVSISLPDLEKKFTPDCVAVLPVHFGGHPVEMDKLLEFARLKNLKVIEDCAHCAGGEYGGKKLGTWGDIGCFSFEEKKCMTCGDGGMLTFADENLVTPLNAYRWMGIDKDTWKREKDYTAAVNPDARHWYYEVSLLGFKYNMNDLSAAIGLAQLKKLDSMNSKRADMIKRYMKGIKNCRHIQPLFPYDPDRNVYWIFGVRCRQRDKLIVHLKSKEIATGVHYMPLTRHPLFKPYQNTNKTADEIWETFVTLPLHADLSDEEIDYVIETLKDFG